MENVDVVDAVKEVAADVVDSKVIDLAPEAVKKTVSITEKTIGKTGLTYKEVGVGLGIAGIGAGIAETVRFCVKKKPITRGFNKLMDAFGFQRKPKEAESTPKGEVRIDPQPQQPEGAAETEAKE